MKEKKHRVEDALQATRAALEEGIVPGGGIALLQATKAIGFDGFEDEDEKTGAKIVLRALEEPLRQIVHNGGFEGSVVVNDVRKAKKGQGLNTITARSWTSSPPASSTPRWSRARPCRTPASIAKNILTTEAIVAEIPEKESGGSGGMARSVGSRAGGRWARRRFVRAPQGPAAAEGARAAQRSYAPTSARSLAGARSGPVPRRAAARRRVAKYQRMQLLALIGLQLGGPAGADGLKQSGVVAAAGGHVRDVRHQLPGYAYGSSGFGFLRCAQT
jgi:hypothetical protein